MRYLDLVHPEGVLQRFPESDQDRAVDSQHARRQGFVEIEGPTLHDDCRRAAATRSRHHNALDLTSYCESPWSCT